VPGNYGVGSAIHGDGVAEAAGRGQRNPGDDAGQREDDGKLE
jgi:hypothetical protein